MRTQQEGSRLQSKERGLPGHQLCCYLDLELPASRTVRKIISVVEATQSFVLCYGSLSRVIHSFSVKTDLYIFLMGSGFLPIPFYFVVVRKYMMVVFLEPN